MASLPIGSIAIERDTLSRWKHYDSPFYHSKFPQYDPVGNLLHYHYQDSLGKVDCVYRYDDLNQLLSENDHTYSFDSLNNGPNLCAYLHNCPLTDFDLYGSYALQVC